MTKQELLTYLRDQAFFIKELTEEIEQKGTTTGSWLVDLKLPVLTEEIKHPVWDKPKERRESA